MNTETIKFRTSFLLDFSNFKKKISEPDFFETKAIERNWKTGHGSLETNTFVQ